jgi:hypothetical protein
MATKIRLDMPVIAEKVYAAMNQRCGCGYAGDWDHPVFGTSGDKPCVWAGCPTCRGQAVGVPLLAPDYRAWERLTLAEQRSLIAVAAIRRVFGDGVKVAGWVDQSDLETDRSRVRVEWTEGDRPPRRRIVRFEPESYELAENIEGHR